VRQKKWAAFEEFVQAHGDSLVRGPQEGGGGGLVGLANHPQIPAGFTQVPAPK
jgi:hypothetical protein